MPDQADKLRQLVCDTMPPSYETDGPPIVAVSGGKGGVGATTVAVNLAASLAHRGERVVLVDAARQHADVAGAAGIEPTSGHSLGDVLAGRCSAAEALFSGPAGTQMLVDRWAPDSTPDSSFAAQQRLLTELQGLAPLADVLVVDTGSGMTPWTARIWQQARLALAVTTADDLAVMDTYATIKLGVDEPTAGPDIRVVVNRCDSERAASDACNRIAKVCQRFLGRTIGRTPVLPMHVVADDSPPRVWEMPRSVFGRSADQLAAAVAESLAATSCPLTECCH